MNIRTIGLGLLLGGLLSTAASAQGIGTTLKGGVELEDLSATSATSFEDFQGRAILIEFFAYW